MLEPDAVAGLRLLVVEDEYFLATELAAELSSWGVVVVGPAPDVEQALNLLLNDRVDGAVLDVNLGEQLVFPVADALDDLQVPYVFLTAYDGVFPAGHSVAPRLVKPAFFPEVLRAIRALRRNRVETASS